MEATRKFVENLAKLDYINGTNSFVNLDIVRENEDIYVDQRNMLTRQENLEDTIHTKRLVVLSTERIGDRYVPHDITYNVELSDKDIQKYNNNPESFLEKKYRELGNAGVQPSNFYGHSPSTGDAFVIYTAEVVNSHYIASFGYVQEMNLDSVMTKEQQKMAVMGMSIRDELDLLEEINAYAIASGEEQLMDEVVFEVMGRLDYIHENFTLPFNLAAVREVQESMQDKLSVIGDFEELENPPNPLTHYAGDQYFFANDAVRGAMPDLRLANGHYVYNDHRIVAGERLKAEVNRRFERIAEKMREEADVFYRMEAASRSFDSEGKYDFYVQKYKRDENGPGIIPQGIVYYGDAKTAINVANHLTVGGEYGNQLAEDINLRAKLNEDILSGDYPILVDDLEHDISRLTDLYYIRFDRMVEAMRAAGYEYDNISSSNDIELSEDYIVFNGENGTRMEFNSLFNAEEWLDGGVFDDPEVSSAVEKIMHPERFENVSNNKPEIENATIEFFVAESMEFHSLGEYHEGLTLQEAFDVLDTIPSERLNGGKGIGFDLHDGSMYEGGFDLVVGTEIQEDLINEIEHYRNSPLVQQAIRDAKAEIERRYMTNEQGLDLSEDNTRNFAEDVLDVENLTDEERAKEALTDRLTDFIFDNEYNEIKNYFSGIIDISSKEYAREEIAELLKHNDVAALHNTLDEVLEEWSDTFSENTAIEGGEILTNLRDIDVYIEKFKFEQGNDFTTLNDIKNELQNREIEISDDGLQSYIDENPRLNAEDIADIIENEIADEDSFIKEKAARDALADRIVNLAFGENDESSGVIIQHLADSGIDTYDKEFARVDVLNLLENEEFDTILTALRAARREDEKSDDVELSLNEFSENQEIINILDNMPDYYRDFKMEEHHEIMQLYTLNEISAELQNRIDNFNLNGPVGDEGIARYNFNSLAMAEKRLQDRDLELVERINTGENIISEWERYSGVMIDNDQSDRAYSFIRNRDLSLDNLETEVWKALEGEDSQSIFLDIKEVLKNNGHDISFHDLIDEIKDFRAFNRDSYNESLWNNRAEYVAGYIENSKYVEVPMGKNDWIYTTGRDDISVVSFNPDSGAGGTITYDYISYDQIREAHAEAADDQDFVYSFFNGSYQENLDIDNPTYKETVAKLANDEPDMVLLRDDSLSNAKEIRTKLVEAAGGLTLDSFKTLRAEKQEVNEAGATVTTYGCRVKNRREVLTLEISHSVEENGQYTSTNYILTSRYNDVRAMLNGKEYDQLIDRLIDEGNYFAYTQQVNEIISNEDVEVAVTQLKEFKETLVINGLSEYKETMLRDYIDNAEKKLEAKHLFIEADTLSLPKINNPSSGVVFDTETTGLSSSNDEILQLSIMDLDGNELFNSYLKPYWKTEWSQAVEVHGITPEMVENAPYPHEILPQIKAIFNSADTLVAYNAEFDIRFLKEWGINFEGKEVYDVMKEFAPVYGEADEKRGGYRWQKLAVAAEYYRFEFNAHDSMEDIKATLHCYNKLKEREVIKEQVTQNLTEKGYEVTDAILVDGMREYGFVEDYESFLFDNNIDAISTFIENKYFVENPLVPLVRPEMNNAEPVFYWENDVDARQMYITYYNPDAESGGQFVNLTVGYNDILLAKEQAGDDVAKFFDLIEQGAYVQNIDIDTPAFKDWANSLNESINPELLLTSNRLSMDQLAAIAEYGSERSVQLSDLYKLAIRIDAYAKETDPYGYNDMLDFDADIVWDTYQQLKKGVESNEVQGIISYLKKDLEDYAQDGNVGNYTDYIREAKDLLYTIEHLDEYYQYADAVNARDLVEPIREFHDENGKIAEGERIPLVMSNGIFAEREHVYAAVRDYEEKNAVAYEYRVIRDGSYEDKQFLYDGYDQYIGESHQYDLSIQKYMDRVNEIVGYSEKEWMLTVAEIYYAQENGLDEQQVKYMLDKAENSDSPYWDMRTIRNGFEFGLSEEELDFIMSNPRYSQEHLIDFMTSGGSFEIAKYLGGMDSAANYYLVPNVKNGTIKPEVAQAIIQTANYVKEANRAEFDKMREEMGNEVRPRFYSHDIDSLIEEFSSFAVQNPTVTPQQITDMGKDFYENKDFKRFSDYMIMKDFEENHIRFRTSEEVILDVVKDLKETANQQISEKNDPWGAWFGRIADPEKPENYIDIAIMGYSTRESVIETATLVVDGVVSDSMGSDEINWRDYVAPDFKTGLDLQVVEYIKQFDNSLEGNYVFFNNHGIGEHRLEEHYRLLTDRGYSDMPVYPQENLTVNNDFRNQVFDEIRNRGYELDEAKFLDSYSRYIHRYGNAENVESFANYIENTYFINNPIGREEWYLNYPTRQTAASIRLEPESVAGGQFVITPLPHRLVLEAKALTDNVEDFFKYIHGVSPEYVEINTHLFKEIVVEYAQAGPNYTGRSEETMNKLVADAEFSRDYENALGFFADKGFISLRNFDPEYYFDHASELIYCHQNDKSFDDFQKWASYKNLLKEDISFDDYIALDSRVDVDVNDISVFDTKAFSKVKELYENFKNDENSPHREEILERRKEVAEEVKVAPLTERVKDKSLSKEEKMEMVKKEISNGVLNVLNSDSYRSWLDANSRLFFKRYSFNNAILVWLQNPQASYTMGYKAWNEFGRHVKAGEKGLVIRKPITLSEKQPGMIWKQIQAGLTKEEKNNPGEIVSYKLASTIEVTRNKNKLYGLILNGKETKLFTEKELEEFIKFKLIGKHPIGFDVTYTYDYSQTVPFEHIYVKELKDTDEPVLDNKGKPIKDKSGNYKVVNTPERQKELFNTELDMSVPEINEEKAKVLYESLKAISEKNGIPVFEKERAEDDTLRGGADGYFSRDFSEHKNGYIVIPTDLSGAKLVSVMLHEMTHSELHGDLDKLAEELGVDNVPSHMREVQAESVAYMVGQRFGIETETSSFQYLAAYTQGFELKTLEQSFEIIYNECQSLTLQLQKELEGRGYSLDLSELDKTPMDKEKVNEIAKEAISDAVLKDEINQGIEKDICQHIKENAGNEQVVEIIKEQALNIDRQNADIAVVKDAVSGLVEADNRDDQQYCINVIEGCNARIAEQKEEFDGLSKDFSELAQESSKLKNLWVSKPEAAISQLKELYPPIENLSKAQINYLSKSEYVNRELSPLLRNNPEQFAQLACERANQIDKVSSKNGMFAEVSFCEQWFDKPIFIGGEMMHPKVADTIVSQSEAQIADMKEKAKPDEYIPYSKCHISIYKANEDNSMTVYKNRIDIGDGTQKSVVDFLKQTCMKQEFTESFEKAVAERGAKEKIVFNETKEQSPQVNSPSKVQEHSAEDKSQQNREKYKSGAEWNKEIKERKQAQNARNEGNKEPEKEKNNKRGKDGRVE